MFHHQKDYFFYDVNLAFHSGVINFIEGKNGVGKSTFFSILQGTNSKSTLLEGTIQCNGEIFPIINSTINLSISLSIKAMIQDNNKMLISTMTVEQNLQMSRLPYYPQCKALSPIDTILFGMKNITLHPLAEVKKLSGGQKQILAIMMILQKPTKILLLDEPTASLDEENSHMVIEFLANLAQELDIIVIIVTHNREIDRCNENYRFFTIKKINHDRRAIEIMQSNVSIQE